MTEEAREAREAAFKKYSAGFKIPQSERVDFNTAFDAGVAEGIRQAREAVASEEPMRIARGTSGFRGGAVTPEFGVKLALAAIDALEVER